MPVERCRFFRAGGLQQQHAAAASGRLKGHFAQADLGRLAGIEIAYPFAFGEGRRYVKSDGLAVPALADAGCRCCGGLWGRFQAELQRRCTAAGIDAHPIFTVAEQPPIDRRAIAARLQRQGLIQPGRSGRLPTLPILINFQRQFALGQRGLAGEQPGGGFVKGREALQRPACCCGR
ncbi:hypothetical protein D3C80_1608010 [compost metagenome]